MAGVFLGCARRLFSSAARSNRKRVGYRASSSSSTVVDPTQQQAPIIDQAGVMKEAECENRENWKLFKSWKLKHNKNYKSKEEVLVRFNRFCKAKREVERWNKQNDGCTYGLNFLTDMTRREFYLFNGKRACAPLAHERQAK